MPAPYILPMLTTILGVWAVGVFLVLPRHDQLVRREIRIGGCVLIGLSLVLLVVFFGTRPGSWPKPQLGWDAPNLSWWPASELQNAASAMAFLLFGGASVVSALFAVFAGKPRSSIRWFALFSSSAAGLLAFNNAMIPAGIALIGACALFGVTMRVPSATAVGEDDTPVEADSQSSHVSRDPALTSLAGFLFALSLVGTVSYSLLHESEAEGLNSGRSKLTVRFGSASEVRTGANSASAAGAPLPDGYWIVPAVISALAICAAAGFILVTRHSAKRLVDPS